MTSIAVVTGAGSGIGKAVAGSLAAGGHDLALLDLNLQAVREIAGELAHDGRRAIGYEVDVRDAKAIAASREAVVADLGRPSIIVNCAGWSVIQPFVENNREFWAKAIDINLMGTIAVTRAFLDDLIASEVGKVINIASDAGRVGSTGEVVYSAAKGGVIAFTKALAREMARHNISVNCICPGPTATPMLLVQDAKRVDALTKAIPFRRLAEPADIAKVVQFFASSMSDYVTGQVLSVSGGLTMAG
jgi:2-hydroxycyclohexanecarboxyl-CoA dehydrogenase